MDGSYEGREQSAAKHLVLERYLERLAYKVGWNRRNLTLNYIDGFAGPWESRAADLSDTSPYLALRTLLAVGDSLALHGRPMDVRAFFVQPDARAAAALRALAASFPRAHVEVEQSTFEDSIEAAARFARGGSNPFAFIFIDPTGWTGFGLRRMTPLLTSGANEALINFMTKDVVRFVDAPRARTEETREMAGFVDLFGDASYREAWRGLDKLQREETIVQTYCDRVRAAGRYRHCVSSVVLNPLVDRTHFHLVYGTRSDDGLVTFRGVEKASLEFQQATRAAAKQRKQETRSKQPQLFAAADVVSSAYQDELRERYTIRARALLDGMVAATTDVAWRDLIIAALEIPMVSEADVKKWAVDRVRERVIELELPKGRRVPVWNGADRVRRMRR
jgi:three-Cys-motif partner protein